MDRTTRIAVVGAGLGGLTAAGFLQRAGFPVKVYEQAPAFSRIGAGIILCANVTKVLRRLGLEAGPHRRRHQIAELRQPRLGHRRDAWPSSCSTPRAERRYGGPYVHIHRGDLHAVLERGVAPGTIAFDHQLVICRRRAAPMRLIFGNGATAEADIVIGADGIRSKVREFVIDRSRRNLSARPPTGRSFRPSGCNGFKIPDCTKWWGARPALPALLPDRQAR